MAGTGTVSVTPTEAPKTVTESARISGGNLVAKALKNEGVEAIFTLCGGHIIYIYDGCLNEGIKIVDVRHEQVAAHAADGYWRVSGKTGCAVVTAGPGTTDPMTRGANALPPESPTPLLGGPGPPTHQPDAPRPSLAPVATLSPLP